MVGFIDGPLWYFSLLVFVVGVLWRLFSIARAGSRPDYSEPRRAAAGGAISSVFRRFVPRRDMAANTRLQTVAGYMFHLGLFALLFFAAPHVAFVAQYLPSGTGWASMPYWAFIVASELAFAGLLVLLLYRLISPVSRQISDLDDYMAAVLTFVVMLTGCLALLEASTGLRVLHRFTVELLLIYFPFSRLMHAFTFISSRAFTGAWFGRRGVDA